MLLTLFDRYVFKSLVSLTAVIAFTLAMMILLSQSLKFLELILNAGASGATFWILAFLALPRFFEVILPIAAMLACLFLYSRLTTDSEITVMRAAGASPLMLARPAILLSLGIALLVFFISAWLAPLTLSKMQTMRNLIKNQYSGLLFQKGVFNQIGKNLTVYIDRRAQDGTLEGLLIHDNRKELAHPVTVLAKRGVILVDDTRQQIIVYSGSRQELNPKNGALSRLDFEQYTIDLPEQNPIAPQWKEPDERTFLQLFSPDPSSLQDQKYQNDFLIEIHRRMIAPVLSVTFCLIICSFVLLAPVNRRGQSGRTIIAILMIILLQSGFIGAINIASDSRTGLIAAYGIVFLPLILSGFLLSPLGEKILRSLQFFQRKSGAAVS